MIHICDDVGAIDGMWEKPGELEGEESGEAEVDLQVAKSSQLSALLIYKT